MSHKKDPATLSPHFPHKVTPKSIVTVAETYSGFSFPGHMLLNPSCAVTLSKVNKPLNTTRKNQAKSAG